MAGIQREVINMQEDYHELGLQTNMINFISNAGNGVIVTCGCKLY